MLFYAAQLYADFTGGIDITIGIAQFLAYMWKRTLSVPSFQRILRNIGADGISRWERGSVIMFLSDEYQQTAQKADLDDQKTFWHGRCKTRCSIYFDNGYLVCNGIWHGAAWHFVAWGLVNGVIILISEECTPLYNKFHHRFPKLGNSWGYRAFQVIGPF